MWWNYDSPSFNGENWERESGTRSAFDPIKMNKMKHRWKMYEFECGRNRTRPTLTHAILLSFFLSLALQLSLSLCHSALILLSLPRSLPPSLCLFLSRVDGTKTQNQVVFFYTRMCSCSRAWPRKKCTRDGHSSLHAEHARANGITIQQSDAHMALRNRVLGHRSVCSRQSRVGDLSSAIHRMHCYRIIWWFVKPWWRGRNASYRRVDSMAVINGTTITIFIVLFAPHRKSHSRIYLIENSRSILQRRMHTAPCIPIPNVFRFFSSSRWSLRSTASAMQMTTATRRRGAQECRERNRNSLRK